MIELILQNSKPTPPTGNRLGFYAKSDGFLYVQDVNGTEVQVGNSSSAPPPLPSSDNTVKASASDLTPGFLESKLIQGSGVTLTKTAGPNETITISVDNSNISASDITNDSSAPGSTVADSLTDHETRILANAADIVVLDNKIDGVAKGLDYQGVWNASTNTPSLTSSVGTEGHYYIVSVAGSTNLNGITDWNVGDWVLWSESAGAWQQVDNTAFEAVTNVGAGVGVFKQIVNGTEVQFKTLTNGSKISFASNANDIQIDDSVIAGEVNTNTTNIATNTAAIASLVAGAIPTPTANGSFLVKNTNGTYTMLDGTSGPPMRWDSANSRFLWQGQLDFTGAYNLNNGSIFNFLDGSNLQDAYIANAAGSALTMASNNGLTLTAGDDVYIAAANTGKKITLDSELVETTGELKVGQITVGTQVGLVGYDSAGKLIQGASSGGTQDLDSVLTQGNTTGSNKISFQTYNNSVPSLGDRWSDGQELRGYQRGNQDNDAFDQNMVGASVSLLTSQDVNKCPFGFSQIANSTATNLPNGWETSGVSNVITFGHEPNSTTISQIISSNNRFAQRSTRTGTWVEISSVNQIVTDASTGPEDNDWINGIYKMSVTTGSLNYPSTFGLVHGIREGNSRHFQYFYERYSANVYTRFQDSSSNTWSNWKITEKITQANTNPSSMAVDASLYKQISANNLAQTCTIPLPTNGGDDSSVVYRFRASATSTLTWNAGFNDLKGALPTSIAINKSLYVGVKYDAFTSTWDVVSVVEQN